MFRRIPRLSNKVLKRLSSHSNNDIFKSFEIKEIIKLEGISEKYNEAIQNYLIGKGYIEVVSIRDSVSITKTGISYLNTSPSKNTSFMSPIFDFILSLLRLLKFKVHNTITFTLLTAGMGFFASAPYVNQIINSVLKKEFNIEIINDNDPWFGLLIILIALSFWLIAEKRVSK